MSDNRNRKGTHFYAGSQDEEWPEKMNITKAAKFLGIGSSTMSSLIGSGKIKYELDVLDRRVKLVKRSDLEELLRRRKISS
jgi:hypothetical protein